MRVKFESGVGCIGICVPSWTELDGGKVRLGRSNVIVSIRVYRLSCRPSRVCVAHRTTARCCTALSIPERVGLERESRFPKRPNDDVLVMTGRLTMTSSIVHVADRRTPSCTLRASPLATASDTTCPEYP